LIVRNDGTDKAKAKKDLFIFWVFQVKYLFSSPEKAKFEVFGNLSFSKLLRFLDKLLSCTSFLPRDN